MIYKIPLLLSVVLMLSFSSVGQPNCNVYLYKNDTLCYHGCLEALKAIDYPQGSKESQLHFDKAIQLCPTLPYAYREKSVPYLKRGDFITWKKLIDLAVKHEPKQYLGIRGWASYKFLRDYNNAIIDIEKLDEITDYDIGNSGDGDYHLNIVKALCFKGLGQNEKAIAIIENQLSREDYEAGLYDYFHLGVLKLEEKDWQGAISSFKKQIEINDYQADTYYYLALAYKETSDRESYLEALHTAKEYYASGKYRVDPYTTPMDKIFLEDIDRELNRIASKE